MLPVSVCHQVSTMGDARAADVGVVPHPRLGVDGLAHGAEQPQRRHVELRGNVGAPLHERPDGGRRGVENGDAVAFDHLPEPAPVRGVGRALVHDAGGAVGQRPVDEVAVAGDPADVRGAEEDVLFLEIEHPLRGGVGADQVAAGGVGDALGLAGGARGVEGEQQILGVHRLGVAPRCGLRHQVVIPVVAAVLHRDLGVEPLALHHHHRLDARGAGGGVVGDLLEGDDAAAAIAPVAGHHHLRLHVVDAVAQRLGAEAGEHHAVDGPDAGAGQERDRQLGGHRKVHRDPVALLDPEVPEGVREAVHVLVQVPVGEGAPVAGLALPDERRLVAPGGADVAVDAVHAGVDLPAQEPLDGGRRPLAHRVPGAAPLELARELRPEPLVIAVGLVVDGGVVGVRLRLERLRRLEYPIFLQQRVESVRRLVSLGHGKSSWEKSAERPAALRPGRLF